MIARNADTWPNATPAGAAAAKAAPGHTKMHPWNTIQMILKCVRFAEAPGGTGYVTAHPNASTALPALAPAQPEIGA